MPPARAPLCARCGYQLSGIPADGQNRRTCPECGLTQDAATRLPARTAFRAIIGFLVGALATVPALLLALSSIGDGHGDFKLARMLFPFSMISTRLTGEITAPLIILALVQFPIYGAAAGALSTRRLTGHLLLGAIVLVHVITVGLCFSGLLHFR